MPASKWLVVRHCTSQVPAWSSTVSCWCMRPGMNCSDSLRWYCTAHPTLSQLPLKSPRRGLFFPGVTVTLQYARLRTTAGMCSSARERTLSTKVVAAMLGPCRSSSVPRVKMWKRVRWPWVAVSWGRLQYDSPAPGKLSQELQAYLCCMCPHVCSRRQHHYPFRNCTSCESSRKGAETLLSIHSHALDPVIALQTGLTAFF